MMVKIKILRGLKRVDPDKISNQATEEGMRSNGANPWWARSGLNVCADAFCSRSVGTVNRLPAKPEDTVSLNASLDEMKYENFRVLAFQESWVSKDGAAPGTIKHTYTNVNSSRPQGFILWPLLFLIHKPRVGKSVLSLQLTSDY